MQYIDIVENDGRVSHFTVNENDLRVSGGLEHGSRWAPKTNEDAQRLIDWLATWMENNPED